MGRSNTIIVSVIETATEVTIGLDRSSGFPGAVMVLGSLFKAGTINILAGKSIDLLVNGAKVASTVTNSSGRYSFNYTAASGHYSFQARFNGDGLYTADWSPVVTGDYAKVSTSFYGLDISPLVSGGPVTVSIMSQLRRDDTGLGLNAKSVSLYRNKNGGSFTKIATKTTASTSGGPGFTIFSDTLSVIGEYGYYVYFAGDAQFEGCEFADGSTVIDGIPPVEPPMVGISGLGLILLAALVVSNE